MTQYQLINPPRQYVDLSLIYLVLPAINCDCLSEASEEGFVNVGGEDQSADGRRAGQPWPDLSVMPIQISELQHRYQSSQC